MVVVGAAVLAVVAIASLVAVVERVQASEQRPDYSAPDSVSRRSVEHQAAEDLSGAASLRRAAAERRWA